MNTFDLRKYLAEGRLFKEAIDYSSIKGEMKKIYDIDVDLDTIKDFVTSYNDSEGMDVFDTTEREDFYLYLKDEGKLYEGLFSKKPKLYIPKGINQIHNYVNDRQVKDIEAKIKSKEISPKQLSGINSVMMAIEEFLKAKLGIIDNERNGIKFLIYPTGKAGGLTDSKLDLYINLPQKGKPNNLRTNPEETLKMIKVFIDDYLKKQEGIDVASAKVKKSNDTTAYDVTVPISFKELKEK